MASKIEWTEETWNPTVGCKIVSPGCTNCYAMKEAWRFSHNRKLKGAYEGTVEKVNGKPVWTGQVNVLPDRLEMPLRWKKPRRIFVNSMSDLFHEDVPFSFVDDVIRIAARCPQHTFQILTKRAERMMRYMISRTQQAGEGAVKAGLWPLKNVWLGVSVEDQTRADERIPMLLGTPAAVRWLSCEPLLGPVDLRPWLSGLDWVVCGGESGPGARPMHPDWARSLRDQCREAGVPFFFKQWGEWRPETKRDRILWPADKWHESKDCAWIKIGKKNAGALLDRELIQEYPREDGKR